MAQSIAARASTSNPSGKEISKVTWQKLRDNAINKTEFYDISQRSKLLAELITDSAVHPQLETVDFYKGRQISIYDLIGCGKNIALDDILENFKEGQISFVGQAGSGKTTLLKAITRQVIEGKYENLSSIEVIHFVHLRTFKRNDLVTPAELLFRNVTPEMSDAEMKEAMQYATENPNKVLFVIDSLDTVSYTIDGVYTGITTEDRASPEVILFHLLSGNLLPGCRFITSSREKAIINYKGDVRAKQIIALAGLSKESMRKIVIGYVGEEKAGEKMSYLKQKPVIKSLCATPVWLIFTLMVLSIKSKFTPITTAGILVAIFQNMIRSEHVHEGNIEVVVGKLGKMAFTGTKERRFDFSLDELENFKLLASEISDLMVATPSGGYQKLIFGDSILVFAHQLLQEILSAFHIAKMDLEEFKEFISKYIHYRHYAEVQGLLAGILLNSEVFEEAESFLQDATDFAQKRICFRKSLEEQLKWCLSEEDGLRLIELCVCLRECGDEGRDIIQNKVDQFNFFAMGLSSSWMHCIGWAMSLQTSVDILNLSECNLTKPSLSALYHALESGNVQLHELDISWNKTLGPDKMELIVKIIVHCKVKMLNLAGCKLKSDALKAFLDFSVDAKILLLNISKITLDGNDRTLLGKIIKQCGVETLVTWCPGDLKLIDIKDFKLSTDNFKISTLKYRVDGAVEMSGELYEFSDSSCDSLSKFLPYVAKEVIVTECRIPLHIVENFQNRLDAQRNKGLKIIFKKCIFYDDFEEDVEDSEENVEDSEEDVDDSEENVEDSEKDVEDSEKDVEDSEKDVDSKEHVLKCRKPPSENVPSIVENRRAELNNDGSITVSWRYPDENPDLQYHVEASCNDQPTGNIEICRHPYYECKTPRPFQVYSFRIWVVNSSGIAGTAMFTNEVCCRGLVISESLQKKVELDGDHLSVGNCSAVFPRNSFLVSTVVALTAEIDSSKWPKDFLVLTPTLYVNAKGLQKKVCIKLQSWGVIDEQNISTLCILHLPTGSNKWEDTGIVLSFTNSSFLEFEWHDFSPVLGAIRSQNKAVDYRVSGSIFTSEFNELSIAFYVKIDLVFKSVLEFMASQKPPKHLKLATSAFPAKLDETVKTAVNCHDAGFFLVPPGPFSFTVKEYFAEEPEIHYTAISNNSQSEYLVNLICEINKNGNQIEGGSFGFTHMWNPKKRSILQAVHQQYRADVRMREEVGSQRRGNEASPSTEREHDDQFPDAVSTHGHEIQGSSDLVLHPVKGTKRSYEEPTFYEEKKRRPALPSEIPAYVQQPHKQMHVGYRPVLHERKDQPTRRLELQTAPCGEIHSGLIYSLPNPYQPSTSMYVPPSSTEMTAGGQWQHYYNYGETTLNVEKRRPAPPPVIKGLSLVMGDTSIRASWGEVEDDYVTYCVDLYCNGQKQNTEPYKTPDTSIEFSRLEPSCEYRCEVWARNSYDLDGRKSWTNAVKTHEGFQAPERSSQSSSAAQVSVRDIIVRGNAIVGGRGEYINNQQKGEKSLKSGESDED